VNNDNLMDSLEQQQTTADDTPKLEQFLLDSIAAAVTSSSTSVTSSTLGYQNFGGNGGSSQSSQNIDPPEMPQLMSILNELLDGQDLTSLANTGGNGDNIQDMEEGEENYEDDSPRKDDPEEITRLLAQQRLEEISREEQQLQRKMDFLIRRLYKLVARSTGLHASEEIAGFLEHVARHNARKDREMKEAKFPCLTANLQMSPISVTQEPPLNLLSSPSAAQEQSHQQATTKTDVIDVTSEQLKPVPLTEMKSFLRRIESLSTMQSTVLNKRTHAMKYFTKPSPNGLSSMTKSEINVSNNTIPRFEAADVEQVDQVSGLLMSEMRLIEKQIDSDATASSSGGESADEMVVYNNLYQQPLTM
jgi:KAT8 regulatory NSL complex subunit 1